MGDETPVHISYPLTEVLGRIERAQSDGFREMRTLIGDKASKTDLDALRRDLDHHREDTDRRIESIEMRDKTADTEARVRQDAATLLRAHKSSRWRIAATIASITAAWATVVTVILIH